MQTGRPRVHRRVRAGGGYGGESALEEQPRLFGKGSGGADDGPRNKEEARPKERSFPRCRGRRRQRDGGDTPWRIPRWNTGGTDSSDSERNHSTSIRKRDGIEDTDSATPESCLEPAKESLHPLIEAINSLETDKELPGARETREAAL
ncbi:hypothetical protein NDU88_006667 [Pleurodeles waltl]|uniref:Uncharacterized protein n=1 Tax=Pleurodeles waltl TaxID=8319 RepID=A0AAV7X1Y7_PLEWA|nr:hypothetical protein NDU88_006667 [Pleurodeles waltl]